MSRPIRRSLPEPPAPGTIGVLTTSGPIFRCDGQPWRWKGVSAFRLLDHFAREENIDPFLAAYAGFNVLRVWLYVMWANGGWWTIPNVETIKLFLAYCAARGFYVELTLLTDDDPTRIPEAQQIVAALAQEPRPTNLLIEIGNEPQTHKNINTPALRVACETSGFLFSSGDYENSDRFFGTYLTAHTPRDDEWPRKAHDLLEYWTGGGPTGPNDPAHKVPIVADEPKRPDQAGYIATDFYAYAAACSLLGAGATFHSERGKQAEPPTADEARCRDAFLRGLTVFPSDVPGGPYRRIDEHGDTLRTYTVGSYMVRVRPQTTTAPEPGWTALDEWGICWRRA